MAPEHRPRPTRRSRSVPKGTVPPSLAILGYHQQLGSPSENAMATTKCAVYEPPITSLPYLVVVFLPDGTIQVQPFASAKDAEAYAEQVAPQGTRGPD